MVRRVHHINVLVRDLEAAILAYQRALNMPVTRRDALPARGVVAARFRVGQTWIVLVQPTRPDSLPARHLAKHGEGLFLLSLEVDSLDQEVERLGPTAFDGEPRRGADDWLVRDLHRAETCGAQLQYCQESPG